MCAQIILRKSQCLNMIVSEIITLNNMIKKVLEGGGEKKVYQRIFKENKITNGTQKYVNEF